MTIRVMEETADNLPAYAQIPIVFRVESRYHLSLPESGDIGFLLSEERAEPYNKDYDAIAGEGPLAWYTSWDLANWGFLACYVDDRRAGGAAIAWKTEGLCDLEGRDDVAALWDIRVHPDYRGTGVGFSLFDSAVKWAQARGCRVLKIETQNTNVPACRFNARQGCEMEEINLFAYTPDLDEIQIIWRKIL
jgi:GNAT superfamily N-acetyltransferase